MKKMFSKRSDLVEEYFFSQKLKTISELRAAGHEILSLGIGGPDLPPPTCFTETFCELLRSSDASLHGYNSHRGEKIFREAFSQWLKSFFKIEVNPDQQILPLLGSKEGLSYLSQALLNPSDYVLVPDTGYAPYAVSAKLCGAKISTYPLLTEQNLSKELKKIELKIKKNRFKIFWANYPHMPTGTKASLKVLNELKGFCESKKILLAHDNPYALLQSSEAPLSVFHQDSIGSPYVCEFHSLSKSHHLAGWRVGALIGPSTLLEQVLKMKSQVDSGMNKALQLASAQMLKKTPSSWFLERNQELKKRRDFLEQVFIKQGFTFSEGQVGLFLWGKAPKSLKSVELYCEKLLHEKNIFTVPGSVFGKAGKNFIRLSLCTPLTTLHKIEKRLHLTNEK